MFFEALDILEGFRQGTYSTLLNRTSLAAYLKSLRRAIPKNLHRFLLPRCERALEALVRVDDGWLKDRVGPNGLTVITGSGKREFRSSIRRLPITCGSSATEATLCVRVWK